MPLHRHVRSRSGLKMALAWMRSMTMPRTFLHQMRAGNLGPRQQNRLRVDIARGRHSIILAPTWRRWSSAELPASPGRGPGCWIRCGAGDGVGSESLVSVAVARWACLLCRVNWFCHLPDGGYISCEGRCCRLWNCDYFCERIVKPFARLIIWVVSVGAYLIQRQRHICPLLLSTNFGHKKKTITFLFAKTNIFK